MRSKYAKALYELIELYKYKGQVTLSEENLKTLLKYDVKNYRFSYLLREIDKVYETVNSHTKFSYIPHKNTKSITFIIEK